MPITSSPNCPTGGSAWSSSRSRSASSPTCCFLDEPAPVCRRPRATSFSTRSRAAREIGRAIIDHDMDLVFPLCRAHHRAGRRRRVCGRNAKGDRCQSGACAPSISGRPAMASSLELRQVSAGYGDTRGARGHQPQACAGRERQHHRPQRRRQDHAACTIMGHTRLHKGELLLDNAKASTACRSMRARSRG